MKMRNSVLRLAPALAAVLALATTALAQPPGRRGPGDGFPPPGRGFGPGGGLIRAVDELNLPESKRETAAAAVRSYEDDVRRLADLSGAELLLKLKESLSPEEYRKLKEGIDRLRPRPGGTITADDMVERIMAFDKNKDGKVTADELPERMQDLIAKGDTNKDGALDREEIKKLAAELAREESARATGPGGAFPPGPGGRGRGGPGGPGGRGGRGGPGRGFPPGAIAQAVDDLKLTDKKKETAEAAVKAHQDNVRRLMELARADLLLQMDDLLSAEELKKFKTALDRLPAPGDRPGPRGGPPFGPRGPGRP
jgi:hypothetical protein